MKPNRLAHALASGALIALVGAGCGGSTTSGGAKSGNDAERHTKSKTGHDRDGDGEPDEDAESTAATSRCADGTCFECGAGLCPKGFYCDEGAPGGAACGWLPECAASPSCGCVKQGLGSNCTCDERSSGLYVKCN